MIEGMTVKPYQAIPDNEDLSLNAWAALCVHAIGNPEFRQQFKNQTGKDISKLASRNALDALIDKQTGFEKETLLAFLDWVTINHWGVDE